MRRTSEAKADATLSRKYFCTNVAEASFDEIQFDYARLPDATGLVYREPDTLQNRVAAIDGFLREARTARRGQGTDQSG